MTELKPCPFCGKSVYVKKKPLGTTYGNTTHGYFNCYEFEVMCRNPNCGCRVNLIGNDTVYHTDEEAIKNAIEAWNRRATDGN